MTKIQHPPMPFSRNKLALAVSTALALCPMPLLAAPTGGAVVSGSAVINQSGAVTDIAQHTEKAAINWQGFSVGRSESVNFQQPNSSSITLNRVVGNERSVIEGALKANGQIFLVNSNGVLFTRGSSVNAAGLVASTLDISNEDFEAGRYVFQGSGGNGSVINMGTLSAADGGYVALLGKEALNQGVILATRGTAALSAGEKITLNFNGDSLVNVSIDQGALDALVENKQAIYADGGKVFLTAKAADELIGSQVNNDGLVQAQTLDDLKGEIVVHAYGGTADIDGTLDASAPNGGDGGFIETSGHKVKIAETAHITTRSQTGKTGQWLIDPDGYTIANNGGDISATQLSNILSNNDTNIAIESTQGSGADGDLDVNDAVSWNSNAKLALKATNDVNVNAALTASGDTAGLSLTAGQDVNVNAGVTLSGNHATVAVNHGRDYKIRTKASYSGTEPGANGVPVAKQDTSGGVYGSITLSGTDSSLKINDQDYTLIRSMDDLAAISGTVGYYALAKNLDAADWSSAHLGAASVVDSLSGVLTGLGHTVSNLTLRASGTPNTLNGSWLMGFIGQAIDSTTIRDLGIVNADLAAADPSAAAGGGLLAGVFTGTLSTFSTLYNVYSTGSFTGTSGVGGLVAVFGVPGSISYAYSDANISASSGGGLASRVAGATIDHVHAAGNINGLISDGGGLIGHSDSSSIYNAYATGAVTGGDASLSLGGLVGKLIGQPAIDGSALPLNIENSFATGNVTGGMQLGGLVGQMVLYTTVETPVTVKNSYATGNVTGNYPGSGGSLANGVGGLIGVVDLNVSYGLLTVDRAFATGNVTLGPGFGATGYAGGLIGNLMVKAGTISNSYATGDVYAPKAVNVGGFIGWAQSRGTAQDFLTISDSYSTGDATGLQNIGGFIGRTAGAFTQTNTVITRSWSSGKAVSTRLPSDTGLRNVGGLIGQASRTVVNSDVYYNSEGVARAFGNEGNTVRNMGTDNSHGLSGEQLADIQYYANGTIDQVLAERAAAQAAAEAAAQQAATEAAAQAAAQAAQQAATEAAAQAAAQAATQSAQQAAARASAQRAAEAATARTTSLVGSTRVSDTQRQTVAGVGAITLSSVVAAPNLDSNIVINDPGSYSANVRRIEVDGVIYDLEEE